MIVLYASLWKSLVLVDVHGVDGVMKALMGMEVSLVVPLTIDAEIIKGPLSLLVRQTVW